MRNFIISLCCLVFLISCWSVFHMYSAYKLEYFDSALETITTEYVNKEKWDKAKTSFAELQDNWTNYKKPANFFLDSEPVNHIDCTFRKVHYYISADDRSNASGELAYLRGLFQSLHNNDSLSFNTVF